jgi:CRP/FNR family transcriptional regulator, cyclic AMP receptor protein
VPDTAALTKRLTFLRCVPLFAGLKEDLLQVLARDFRPLAYEKDAIIFRQGDTDCNLYLIAEGKVRVFKLSPSGNETSINIFSAGDVIGEFAAIDCQPRSATAKAIEPCTLLEMAGQQLLQRMREMPDLAINMTRLLVGKVRWTAEYAEAIAQYDAAGRLLHILLLYNEQFGRAIEAGKRYELDLALNQTDLASLVGARREWVNRILKNWLRQGLIEYEAGKIIILDLPKVQRERDSRIEAHRQEVDW